MLEGHFPACHGPQNSWGNGFLEFLLWSKGIGGILGVLGFYPDPASLKLQLRLQLRLNLIPGPGTLYALGWPKGKKKCFFTFYIKELLFSVEKLYCQGKFASFLVSYLFVCVLSQLFAKHVVSKV